MTQVLRNKAVRAVGAFLCAVVMSAFAMTVCGGQAQAAQLTSSDSSTVTVQPTSPEQAQVDFAAKPAPKKADAKKADTKPAPVKDAKSEKAAAKPAKPAKDAKSAKDTKEAKPAKEADAKKGSAVAAAPAGGSAAVKSGAAAKASESGKAKTQVAAQPAQSAQKAVGSKSDQPAANSVKAPAGVLSALKSDQKAPVKAVTSPQPSAVKQHKFAHKLAKTGVDVTVLAIGAACIALMGLVLVVVRIH